MSHLPARLRSLGVAGFAALIALAVAPVAHAAPLNVKASCAFPQVGQQDVVVGLDVTSPIQQGPTTGQPFKVMSVTLPAAVDGLGASVDLDFSLGHAVGFGGFPGETPTSGTTVTGTTEFAYPLTAPVAADPLVTIHDGEALLYFSSLTGGLRVRDAGGDPVVLPAPGSGPDSDGDPASVDIPCTLATGRDLAVAIVRVSPVDNELPTKPTNLKLEQVAPDAIKVTWDASTDDTAVAKYLVSASGPVREIEASDERSVTFSGQVPGDVLDVEIRAVDNLGAASEPLTGSIRVGTFNDPYGTPTAPAASAVTSTSVTLTWDKTEGLEPPFWQVAQNGLVAKKVGEGSRSTTMTGLTPNTTYRFFIISGADRFGTDFSPEIEVTTPPAPVGWSSSLGVAGSAAIKTLVRGNVPLKGGLNLDVDGENVVTGDLVLVAGPARLTALGFLPVTAQLQFVAAGKTTGSFLGGQLNTTTKVRIKVAQARLFGAIPLVGGNSCQTRKLSAIPLNSGPGFDPVVGGTLTGTFAISDLNGCGSLNGLVSPTTSGAGNTISLAVKPTRPPVADN